MAIMNTNNLIKKLSLLAVTLSISNIASSCPCFNHHNLIREFRNHPMVTCHLIHVQNSKVISIRLSDKDRIANASTTQCRLTYNFRNIANQYFSYKRSHQNCIQEVVRACKRLNLPIMGADTDLRAKLYGI